MPAAPARLLAYSHDGYGLGHLRRNLRITAGLRHYRPDVEVLLATGARGAESLASAYGIACVQLPSVVKAAAGRYDPAEPGAPPINAVVARRSAILALAVTDFAPDVLLVDRHPRGLHRELEPALNVLRRRPLARAVLGLRDILDVPEVIAREWAEQELTAAIGAYYDAVLCYGDRQVYDLAAEYRLPGAVANRLRYTGYLTDDLQAEGAAAIRQAHSGGARLAVCTLGGGQDAAGIARVFLDAMARLREQGWRGILITGPYMAASDVAALRGHPAAVADTAVIEMATDVPSYLAAADAVLCMGGYNTTCEVLALAVPAVVVPRVTPRLEQLMRSQRLADRGLLHWLHPDDLSPAVVARSLATVADTPQGDLLEQMASIAHDGVRMTSLALSELLPRPPAVHTAQEAANAIS